MFGGVDLSLNAGFVQGKRILRGAYVSNGSSFFHPECKKAPGHAQRTIETIVQPMQKLQVDSGNKHFSKTTVDNAERDRLAKKIAEGKESCRGCGKVIGGLSMDWNGHWHVECLVCSHCKTTLVDKAFAEGDGACGHHCDFSDCCSSKSRCIPVFVLQMGVQYAPNVASVMPNALVV